MGQAAAGQRFEGVPGGMPEIKRFARADIIALVMGHHAEFVGGAGADAGGQGAFIAGDGFGQVLDDGAPQGGRAYHGVFCQLAGAGTQFGVR